MTELVVMDVGGTHARFAVATLPPGGSPVLSRPVKLYAADHPTLADAYRDFAARHGAPLPRQGALAVATPVDGDYLKLTNSHWRLRRTTLAGELDLENIIFLNDFGAITYAVAELRSEHLHHLCGPDTGLPAHGAVSVVGPGTGLGVGLLLRSGGRASVVETEGGHIDFAPCDAIEDLLLQRLRAAHGRVSVERICSGPALAEIHDALHAIRGQPALRADHAALWTAAATGADRMAVAALDVFCRALGCVTGNIALAQGAKAVVLAGGIPPRILTHLAAGGFAERFRAKGRFAAMMDQIPVYVCLHPEPGLLGAAVAFRDRR